MTSLMTFCLCNICCRNHVVLFTFLSPPFIYSSAWDCRWVNEEVNNLKGLGIIFFLPSNESAYYWNLRLTALYEFLWVAIKKTLKKKKRRRRRRRHLTDTWFHSESLVWVEHPWTLRQDKFWSCKKTFICPLTILGDWGPGKSFHIWLQSPPIQIEQYRFCCRDPSLIYQLSHSFA